MTKESKNKESVTLRHVSVPNACVRLRESPDGDESRVITGYAILFNTPSEPLYSDDTEEIREVIDPSAVTLDLLDASDIKFTMYHDRQILLGRSNCGKGTLSYFVDERGIGFELDLPKSPNGDEALEMVRRGDISGCSFAFATRYWDRDFVAREVKTVSGRTSVTYRVKVITGIYDFTLASDPAYPATSVETREFVGSLRLMGADPELSDKARMQISEMRDSARRKMR